MPEASSPQWLTACPYAQLIQRLRMAAGPYAYPDPLVRSLFQEAADALEAAAKVRAILRSTDGAQIADRSHELHHQATTKDL